MTCPCKSGKDFEECCRPILTGDREAVTAEELMRARYSAYATEDMEFLRASTASERRKKFHEESAREWSRDADWQGLEIVATEGGGPDDSLGTVEFKAHYVLDGEDHEHHERAEFRKDGGRWYFVDGKVQGGDPIVREEPKVGRNDPCPCGSGKKFKKCCG